MGGDGLIGLSNKVIGRLGLDGEREGDGGLVLDAHLPIVLAGSIASKVLSKRWEDLLRSRQRSASACSRSGPMLLPASRGMGMLLLMFMSALNSSSSTRIGDLGLGEAMDRHP